jgi:WD repeat-containing protein 35
VLLKKEEKVLEHPWKPAEAFHFFILAQRQFYEGNIDAAFVTV